MGCHPGADNRLRSLRKTFAEKGSARALPFSIFRLCLWL
jgi:hypothetical protein